jgi:uncharacterized membrane protein YfcA
VDALVHEPLAGALSSPAFAVLLASAVVAFGAAVQGAIGFGMALVTAPLLVMIRPDLVPGPLMMSGFALTLLVSWRERDQIDLRGVSWALVGRVPGVALGALALALVPERAMSPLVGLSVLAGVALSATRLRLEPTRSVLLGAGIVSGIFGTIASIGGPPLALVYQYASGPRLRGTLAGYFMVGALMSLVGLVAVGRFGASEALWTLLLTPGTVLGFACSGRFMRWVDAGRTRRAVLGTSVAAGIAAVLRAFV